jgi:hypothetical protein
MGTYEAYLGRLKQVGGSLDAPAQLNKIEARVKSGRRLRIVEEGALLLVLAGIAIYLALPAGGTSLADYIFHQDQLNGDQVANYILVE